VAQSALQLDGRCGTPHLGGDARTEQLDAAYERVVRDPRVGYLNRDPRDAAQGVG
jgi:hypothetical protein